MKIVIIISMIYIPTIKCNFLIIPETIHMVRTLQELYFLFSSGKDIAEMLDEPDTKNTELLKKIIVKINDIEKFQKEEIYHEIISSSQLSKFRTSYTNINNIYDTFTTIVMNGTFSNKTLLNFVDNAISYDNNHLMGFINEIYYLCVPIKNRIETEKNMFTLLAKKEIQNKCGNTITLRQKIFYGYFFEIYQLITKGFLVRAYSYVILKQLTSENYTTEIAYNTYKYQEYIRNIFISAQNSMTEVSNYIYTCDPYINYDHIEIFNCLNSIALSGFERIIYKCDDYYNPDATRKFYKHTVWSNVFENYVITGVRFVKNRFNIICIQIQEGKLQDDFTIIPDTVHWNEVPDLDLYHEYDKTEFKFNLGDYEIPSDKIGFLIGMNFVHGNEIKIRYKYMNTKNKFSIGDNGYEEQFLPSYRTEIEIKGNPLKIPIVVNTESEINIEKNKFIKFQTTTQVGRFFTVPFIDSQPIVTDPPSPIVGVGVYYKGLKNSGGYIGLKIAPFDYSKLLEF